MSTDKKYKLEDEVKKEIKAAIDDAGGWQYMPVQTGYGQQGIPDHITCVPMVVTQALVGKKIGVFVAVEAKRKGKKPTPRQSERIKEIRDAGGIAFYVDGTEDEDGTFSRLRKVIKLLTGK